MKVLIIFTYLGVIVFCGGCASPSSTFYHQIVYIEKPQQIEPEVYCSSSLISDIKLISAAHSTHGLKVTVISKELLGMRNNFKYCEIAFISACTPTLLKNEFGALTSAELLLCKMQPTR